MKENETIITRLLNDWHQGDAEACDKLFPLVYQELNGIAHVQLNRMWNLNTINTTVLVHEAYLKLAAQSEGNWHNRAHFLAVCASAMRQILINYAEQKQSLKRGGDWKRVTMPEALNAENVNSDNLLFIESALKDLTSLDERLGKIVEMRFFGGMNENEIACVLGVTDRTVRREWKKAKALLSQTLAEQIHDQ